MPQATDTSLRDALVAVVGSAGVVTDPARLVVYESDALTRYRSRPDGIVLPGNTEEVAEIVRIFSDRGIPMVPRGAGTGLSGGALASAGSWLIGLARMNRVLRLDGRSRLARVEAGVVNSELSRRAAPLGLHYAPDPSSQTACTLGGNVAENSGGPHCLKYGVTTRYVTGLTLVRADGEIVELGGAGRSDPIDLTGLLVGSEGCFGVVTEIELRLVPTPSSVRTLLGVFDSASAAGAAVSAIVARGLLPAALEIIDRATIEAVEASAFAAGYPTGAGAALVVEFDGMDAGLDEELAHAEGICREFGAIEVRRAASDAERAALWQGRKKAFGAMGRIAPDLMVQDATVPRSVLPEVLEQIEEIGIRYGLRVANVFHAGDGNLHPNILFDRRDEEETARVEKASKEIMHACVDAGGTITGEHGVGIDKRHYMSLVHGPAELAAMGRVRGVFDPRGILNPGKVLPDSDGDEGTAPAFRGDRRGVNGGAEIREYRPEDLTVTIVGSMKWSDLVRETGANRQWVPFLRPGLEDATVAEVVSDGGWSALAERYGGLRDLVLGARVVTAGGPLRLGGRVVKNVAGFDLLRPVVGSGVDPDRIEEVTLRLYPIPPMSRVLRLEVDPAVPDSRVAELIVGLPFLPACALLVRGDGGRRVVVRLDGSAPEIAACEALLGDLCQGVQGVAGWVAGETSIESILDAGTSRRDHGDEKRGGRILVAAAPGPIDASELDAALRELVTADSTAGEASRFGVADLLGGRSMWWLDGCHPERPRWVGLAQRFAEAGGELRADGDAELTAVLDEVRWMGTRACIPVLADEVSTALFGGAG